MAAAAQSMTVSTHAGAGASSANAAVAAVLSGGARSFGGENVWGSDPYPTRGAAPPTRPFLPRADPVVVPTELHGGEIAVDAAPEAGATEAAMPLSPERVAEFEERGFIVLRGVFSADEVAAAATAVEAVRDDASAQAKASGADGRVNEESAVAFEAGTDVVRSVFAVHKGSRPDSASAAAAARAAAKPADPRDVVAKVIHDARIARVAAQLLGSDVYIHQSRVNFQPAFIGTGFFWHSDFETWHSEDGMPRPRCLSAAVMLADNHEWNGALMLVPGSHKTFVACPGETPDAFWEQSLVRQNVGVPSSAALRQLVDNAVAAGHEGIAYATGAAGDVVLFDCNAMHGSHSNVSPLSRQSCFAVYNSVENKPGAPLYAPSPRPEHVATRDPQWQEPIPL